MGVFSKVGRGILCAVKSVGRGMAKVGLALAIGFGAFAAMAEGEVTQPSVTLPAGVDIASVITQGVAILGGVVAVALVGYAGFLVVRKAFRWIGRSLG